LPVQPMFPLSDEGQEKNDARSAAGAWKEVANIARSASPRENE
jgi:hypothetical protein